jgi:eukaryotic-like serine/threonine-protein kinase
VLVRGDGEPALLDFGIAKLLDPNASGRQEATHAQWFTPTYAAPEQRRGEAVSTATDVFALGLLLLEVLTEQVPVQNGEGLALPADLRRADGARLPAELALIVGQATHADPARRYLSPEALSEDLRRFLRGRPVLAAPDSWLYRSNKFLRRHPFAIGAAALALAVIAVSTWRLAAERDRALSAEHRAVSETAAARAVERYLVSLFEAADPDRSGRRQLSPRELVDIGRRQLATSLGDDPPQRARLLVTLGRLYARQGLPAEAIATLDEAADLLRGAAPDSAALVDALEELGNARRDNHEFPRALELLAEGMQRAAQLDGDGGARALRLRSEWALVLVRADRAGEAVGALNDVVARYDAAPALRGSEDHANALLFQSEALLTDNKVEASNQAALRAVTMLRVSHPANDPVLLAALGFLANSYRAKGDFAASENVLQEMLRERLKLYEPDSEMVALVRNELAVIYHSQGRLAQAREQMQLSLASARANLGEDSLSFGVSLNNLASVLEELGEYAEAEPLLRQSLAIAEKNAAEDSSAQVLARQNLGRLLMLSGRSAQALGYLAHPIPAGAEENPILDLQRGRQQFHLGEWERRAGDRSAAARHFDAAEALFKPIVAAESTRWGQLARSRGLLAAEAGDLPDAAARLRDALRIVGAARGQDYPGSAEIQLELAAVLWRSGQAGEARELVATAARTLHAQLSPDAPALQTLARVQAQIAGATP